MLFVNEKQLCKQLNAIFSPMNLWLLLVIQKVLYVQMNLLHNEKKNYTII